MPSDLSVYFTSRLMPGADTLRSLAAPPMVPVTMTARITSTWRSVIICPKLQTSYPVQHQRWPAGIWNLLVSKEEKPIHFIRKLPLFDTGHESQDRTPVLFCALTLCPMPAIPTC